MWMLIVLIIVILVLVCACSFCFNFNYYKFIMLQLYKDWHQILKRGKYLRSHYLPSFILFNTTAALFTVLPIHFPLFLIILMLLICCLKMLYPQQLSSLLQIIPKDCVLQLLTRINLQISNFCWLTNKFSSQCLRSLTLLIIFFFVVDRYVSVSVSWWLLINLLIVYFSLTRYSKSLIKYRLGLYKDYNRYVIHIIQPASPDRDNQPYQQYEQI